MLTSSDKNRATDHRSVPGIGWASDDSDSTAATPKKKAGPPPAVVVPVKKPEPPARLPSPITVNELRALAGSKTLYSNDVRYGLVVISVWMSKQPRETTSTTRRVASNIGSDLVQGKFTLQQVISTLFVNELSAMMLRKSKSMVELLECKSLDENVVDLAVSHISSRCPCTESGVTIAEQYVDELKKTKPLVQASATMPGMWWPDFEPSTDPVTTPTP